MPNPAAKPGKLKNYSPETRRLAPVSASWYIIQKPEPNADSTGRYEDTDFMLSGGSEESNDGKP